MKFYGQYACFSLKNSQIVMASHRQVGADMQTKRMVKEQRLLEKHKLHLGLYVRIAQKLGINPSYVSRVANGERMSPTIMAEIINELRRLDSTLKKISPVP